MADNLMDSEETIPEIDPDKDYLQELVGEGRKFKNEQDLAKGKYISDNYIKILEKRLDEIRDENLELRKTKRLEDLVDQLTKSQSSETPQQKEEQHQPMDPKQIESLVDAKLQARDISRQETINLDMVKDKLKERYGENYKARLQEAITDLGVTEAEIDNLARSQPKVILKTLGLDRPVEREQFTAPPTTTRRSESFAPTGQKERTWAYYQELKKNDPKIYFDRKTAVQMQEDAIALGDKFYDGNFYVKGLHER